jgi:hypothetical protein
MRQTTPTRRRKLKTFKEWLKPFKEHVAVDRQIRRLAEALDWAEAQNPMVDLSYFSTSIEMKLSDQEKAERLADLSDTITAVGEKSDVVILGMWVSPKAR